MLLASTRRRSQLDPRDFGFHLEIRVSKAFGEDGRPVWKHNHRVQCHIHGFNIAPQSRNHQVAPFFNLGNGARRTFKTSANRTCAVSLAYCSYCKVRYSACSRPASVKICSRRAAASSSSVSFRDLPITFSFLAPRDASQSAHSTWKSDAGNLPTVQEMKCL